MGRIYRPVEVECGDRKATTVAIIDTGADETVISERLAGKVNSDLYGVFKAICASDTILLTFRRSASIFHNFYC